jgi:hypothetical protein
MRSRSRPVADPRRLALAALELRPNGDTPVLTEGKHIITAVESAGGWILVAPCGYINRSYYNVIQLSIRHVDSL